MLSGFMTGSTQWLLYITAAAFIPLVISSLLQLLHSPTSRHAFQFAVFYTLMFTSVYAAFNIILIVFFTYFYTSVTFNPLEVANNMKANGGFIPGIRPGRSTVEYLNKVMTRITFVGAIFLALVATMPTLIQELTALKIGFGGTSLLIAVGVGLDTMKQLETQMVMRNYQGFLK